MHMPCTHLPQSLNTRSPQDVNATYEAISQHVKDAIISDRTLWYFDVTHPVTVQVNTSKVSLRAAFLQENITVTFTSKSLTATAHHYAKIGHEMLTIVF